MAWQNKYLMEGELGRREYEWSPTRVHDEQDGRGEGKDNGDNNDRARSPYKNLAMPRTKKSVRMGPGSIPSLSLDRILTL
eukprot:6887598-Heterocapsa_arctica.AAC.1